MSLRHYKVQCIIEFGRFRQFIVWIYLSLSLRAFSEYSGFRKGKPVRGRVEGGLARWCSLEGLFEEVRGKLAFVNFYLISILFAQSETVIFKPSSHERERVVNVFLRFGKVHNIFIECKQIKHADRFITFT